MERERRKGLVQEEMKSGKKKKKKNEKKKEEEPTDEEVDEFFRILKRMRAAMEYFGGVKSTLLSFQRWSEFMADGRQGVEEGDEEDDDDQGEREKLLEEICEKEKKKIKSGHETLDLNADPK